MAIAAPGKSEAPRNICGAVENRELIRLIKPPDLKRRCEMTEHDIFRAHPGMPRRVRLGDIAIRDGIQHEEA